MLIHDYGARKTRSEQNRRVALRFIAEETWTTPQALQAVLDISRSGAYKLITRLKRDGLVRDHCVEELRLTIVGITAHGVALAASDSGTSPKLPPMQPSKIRPTSVMHKIDLQTARARATHSGWSDWTLARHLPRGWPKYPDAVSLDPSGKSVAVELERTVKSRRRYLTIVANHLLALSQRRYDAVHYVCSDASIAASVERMFRSIDRVLIMGKRLTLDERHRALIPVFDSRSWPPLA